MSPHLIFDNMGFKNGADENAFFNLLTGARGNRNGMEPAVGYHEEFPADTDDYVWKIYNFDGYYLFGFSETADGEQINYYLYFDTSDLTFRLTRDHNTAKRDNSFVQIYQLGAEVTPGVISKTPIIVTDESGEIISYPLNPAESSEDLKTYDPTPGLPGETEKNNGEYLIIAEAGRTRYALTFSAQGALMYVDVSPYFSGNYSYDGEGNPCLAINTSYIWRQTAVLTGNNPDLSFMNAGNNQTISGVWKYDFEENQLTIDGQHLTFSVAGGFGFGDTPSEIKIYLWYLGAEGIDTGKDGDLNYTYYNRPLTTTGSGVNFTNFNFKKQQINQLLNFAVGSDKTLEKTIGWRLKNTNLLSEIHTSVNFVYGLNFGDTMTLQEFADGFVKMQNNFTTSDAANGGDTIKGVINYYIPKGSVTFVIGQASSQNPVFVNTIVTSS